MQYLKLTLRCLDCSAFVALGYLMIRSLSMAIHCIWCLQCKLCMGHILNCKRHIWKIHEKFKKEKPTNVSLDMHNSTTKHRLCSRQVTYYNLPVMVMAQCDTACQLFIILCCHSCHSSWVWYCHSCQPHSSTSRQCHWIPNRCRWRYSSNFLYGSHIFRSVPFLTILILNVSQDHNVINT